VTAWRYRVHYAACCAQGGLGGDSEAAGRATWCVKRDLTAGIDGTRRLSDRGETAYPWPAEEPLR